MWSQNVIYVILKDRNGKLILDENRSFLGMMEPHISPLYIDVTVVPIYDGTTYLLYTSMSMWFQYKKSWVCYAGVFPSM